MNSGNQSFFSRNIKPIFKECFKGEIISINESSNSIELRTNMEGHLLINFDDVDTNMGRKIFFRVKFILQNGTELSISSIDGNFKQKGLSEIDLGSIEKKLGEIYEITKECITQNINVKFMRRLSLPFKPIVKTKKPVTSLGRLLQTRRVQMRQISSSLLTFSRAITHLLNSNFFMTQDIIYPKRIPEGVKGQGYWQLNNEGPNAYVKLIHPKYYIYIHFWISDSGSIQCGIRIRDREREENNTKFGKNTLRFHPFETRSNRQFFSKEGRNYENKDHYYELINSIYYELIRDPLDYFNQHPTLNENDFLTNFLDSQPQNNNTTNNATKGGSSSQFIHIPNYGKRKVRYQKNGRPYVIVNKKKLKL